MKLRSLVLLSLGLLFLIFAALQWNDPDPGLWMLVYGLAAVLCWIAYRQLFSRWLFGMACLLYTAAAIFVWPQEYQGITQSMSYSPSIEEARESLGLFICAVAMAFCFFLTPRKINFGA